MTSHYEFNAWKKSKGMDKAHTKYKNTFLEIKNECSIFISAHRTFMIMINLASRSQGHHRRAVFTFDVITTDNRSFNLALTSQVLTYILLSFGGAIFRYTIVHRSVYK